MALDPTNVDALVGVARVDVLVGAFYTSDARPERLAAAEALLIKGLSIAPKNHWAHLWLGFIQILTNRAARGIGELDRALALNRNLGAAHAWKGLAKIAMGRAEETEAHIREAFRVSPADAVTFIWNYISGLAKLHLGADEEASERFRLSTDANRNYPANYFSNAAALALLGRLDEARIEVKDRTRACAELLGRSFSRRGGQRQSNLPRPARAYRGGHAQGRAPGGLTDCMLTSYKGLGAARVSQGD